MLGRRLPAVPHFPTSYSPATGTLASTPFLPRRLSASSSPLSAISFPSRTLSSPAKTTTAAASRGALRMWLGRRLHGPLQLHEQPYVRTARDPGLWVAVRNLFLRCASGSRNVLPGRERVLPRSAS